RLKEQHSAVAVTQEEDGLPVELVGEERRTVEVAALLRDGKRVKGRVTICFHVLSDQSQKRAGGKGVGGLQTRDLSGEEPSGAALAGSDVQPLAVAGEVECQGVRGGNGGLGRDLAGISRAGVGGVDVLAGVAVDGEARDPAGWVELHEKAGVVAGDDLPLGPYSLVEKIRQ